MRLVWFVLEHVEIASLGLTSVAAEILAAMNTVLVPPLLCSAQVYAPILDTVWSHGAVMIADTRRNPSIAGMASRLLDQAPDRFALLGTSMGGYVALEVIRQAPERVTGLALVSTSARADSEEQLTARRQQSQLVQEGQFDALVKAAFPGVVAERHEPDPELLNAWRNMATAVGPDAFLQQQGAVMGRPDSTSLLADITCPTFVIHGEEDRLIPFATGQETAARIPGSTFRPIAKAGHFLFLERPGEAATAVDEFLRSLS